MTTTEEFFQSAIERAQHRLAEAQEGQNPDDIRDASMDLADAQHAATVDRLQRRIDEADAALAAANERIGELERELCKANARIEVLENLIVLDAIQNGRLP